MAGPGGHSDILLGPSGGGSFVQDARRLAAQNDSKSSIAFILFSASIIALIMFTLMKLLSAKLGSNYAANTRRYDKSHDASTGHDKCPGTATTRRQQARCSDDSDLSYHDKKKMSKLSREERTRKLLLRHGGKNLSTAIRFIINEFETQKRLLIAQSGGVVSDGLGQHEAMSHCSCDCSCHLGGTCEDETATNSQEPVDLGQATTTSESDGREAFL